MLHYLVVDTKQFPMDKKQEDMAAKRFEFNTDPEVWLNICRDCQNNKGSFCEIFKRSRLSKKIATRIRKNECEGYLVNSTTK